MSGSAAVRIQEIDLSARVASFEGVFGAIIIRAKKGANLEPRLCVNDRQFLDNFTPNSRVEVGYDLGYYSALSYLERADKIWVKGVMTDGLHAGAVNKSILSTFNNAGIGTGIADPNNFAFDDSIDQASAPKIESIQTVADVADSLDGNGFVLFDKDGSVAFWIDITNGPTPGWVSNYDRAIAITTISTNDTAISNATNIALAINGDSEFSASAIGSVITVTNLEDGVRDDAIDEGTGFVFNVEQEGQEEIDETDDALFIYASSQGAWGNDIGYRITNHAGNEDIVPEEDSFLIEVFKSGIAVPVERFFCSRIVGKKDGFGRNMFVEDVLRASGFIRAISNDLIPSNVYPKAQSTTLFLTGGSDGIAVTDSDMVNALQEFTNPDKISVTLLLDGGNTFPAFQVGLDTIAKTRMDCVAILSVPYSAEIDNDYLNEIIDYRKNQLNLNTSYSALYTPHLRIQDRFNDRQIWVSPDGFVAGSISFNAINNEIWFPPAGFRRGILNVLDARIRYEKGEMDILYNNQINPIRYAPGRGIVIWGQKTLLARPSSLDRLNVRLLLIVVEPALKEFLEDYLFEFNDAPTRSEITVKIEGYLENIRGRRGVFTYDVNCDETNNTPTVIDNNELICDVFLQPNKSAEIIPLRIILLSTGASTPQAI